jgi:HAE1 family hydrophobic/amphiphilic exporter-1
MADGYRRLIGWALDHRKTVVAVALAAFVAGLGVFTTLEAEFMTPMDQGEFVMKLKSAPGASIAETRGRLEQVLKALAESKEVSYTYASIGAGDADTVRDATVFVKLVPKREREVGLRRFIHNTRLRLEKIPGLVISIQEDPDSWQKPLQVAVQGEDIATLKQYAAAVKRELYTVPGIVDIEAQMEHDLPEYRLVVDRERAAASGLGSGALANTVGVLVGGQAVSTYEDEEGEAVDVRVRLPKELRGDVRQVGDLKMTVPTAAGPALVALTDLVTFTRATSPAEIGRRDLTRQVTVDANLDDLPLGTAGTLAMAAAEKVQMAPGYKLVLGGDTEMMVESFGYLAEALLLAVIFVYLILAAQFESFIDPLSIMLSLPLSIVGMAGTLAITGDTINIMSLIGLIMLMGLVTKNAILLVDYTKVLRGRGMDRRTALVTAGRTRLRPILMTTTAMIFGMLPLFFALGEGAEFRAPMARAVVGGLITSTLLTLIVVPVVYTILDDVSAWLLGRKKHVAAVSTAALSVALLIAAAQPVSAQHDTGSAAASPARSLALQVEQAANATAPAGVKVLTLDQALAVAAAQNRDIQKAVEYKHWVEGRYVQERSAALPQGTFGASFARTFDDTTTKLFSGFMGDGNGGSGDTPDLGEIFGGRQDVSVASFGVTQVVFTWGQVGAAIRAAKLGFDYSEQQLRRFRQAVVKDVTAVFYNVLAARELVRIAEDNLAQRTRRLDEVTKRREAGTATDFDVLAAQVELDNAKPAVIRSQNAVRAARAQLRFLLAEPQEVDAEGTLAAPVEPVPSYEELLAKALRHRPELGEIHTQQGIYTELIKIAASGNKPRVDFAANWGKRHLSLQTLSSTGTAWNAGIFATVPIFDGWRTKGQVAQVKSTLASIDIDELKLQEGITLEVRTAVDSAREAVALLEALNGPVKQAQQLLFLAEKGFELGVKTRLEVQDAEQNVNVARANLAAAQRDYRVARVNLDWVAGVLDGGVAPPAPVK